MYLPYNPTYRQTGIAYKIVEGAQLLVHLL